MPLKIRIVGGAADGQSFEFADGRERVTIGRLEDRDVRLPADEIRVSRAHLTIVQENRRYTLHPDGAAFIDGQEVLRDDPLPPYCKLALGTPDGPVLEIHWSPSGDMAETMPQVRRRQRTGAVRAAQRAEIAARAGSRRSVLIAGGAIAAAAAAAGGLFFAAREEPIEAKLAKLRPSVYLVLTRNAQGQERAMGTAWVVAPGALATNAHVADPVAEAMKGGQKGFVRSSVAPYDTIEIAGAASHPHYRAFSATVQRYLPVDARGSSNVIFTNAYDVGILRVVPGGKLAPPLKIAARDRLEALGAGQVAAYIGYPVENLAAGGVNFRAPSPQTQVARLTAVTDFFLVAGDPAHRQLVQHSLPSTGGSSGSPIFNADGEVIAALNAGNMLSGAVGDARFRIPSGVLINFGQRADLVLELLEGRVEAAQALRQVYWTQSLSQFSSGPDYIVRFFHGRAGIPVAPPALERALTLAAPAPGPGGAAGGTARAEFDIPAPGQLLYLGHAEDGTKFRVQILDESGKQVAQSNQTAAFIWVMTTANAAGKTTAALTGDKANGQVKFRIYFIPAKKPG